MRSAARHAVSCAPSVFGVFVRRLTRTAEAALSFWVRVTSRSCQTPGKPQSQTGEQRADPLVVVNLRYFSLLERRLLRLRRRASSPSRIQYTEVRTGLGALRRWRPMLPDRRWSRRSRDPCSAEACAKALTLARRRTGSVRATLGQRVQHDCSLPKPRSPAWSLHAGPEAATIESTHRRVRRRSSYPRSEQACRALGDRSSRCRSPNKSNRSRCQTRSLWRVYADPRRTSSS